MGPDDLSMGGGSNSLSGRYMNLDDSLVVKPCVSHGTLLESLPMNLNYAWTCTCDEELCSPLRPNRSTNSSSFFFLLPNFSYGARYTNKRYHLFQF